MEKQKVYAYSLPIQMSQEEIIDHVVTGLMYWTPSELTYDELDEQHLHEIVEKLLNDQTYHELICLISTEKFSNAYEFEKSTNLWEHVMVTVGKWAMANIVPTQQFQALLVTRL